MTDNVISLRKPPVMHWRCDCGCFSFSVRVDGELECANCYSLVNGVGSWRKPGNFDPDAPELQAEPDDVRVVDMNETRSALRRITRRAEQIEPAFVVVGWDDGALSTWGNISDGEQAEWLDRRLDAAKKMMVKHD